MVHGDDFVITGLAQDLEWVDQELSKTILLKRVGILGRDPTKGDVQEIRVLNRVLRIGEDGAQYEADPRHAEILAAMLGSGVKPVNSPGLREHQGPQVREQPPEDPGEEKAFHLDGYWCQQQGARS